MRRHLVAVALSAVSTLCFAAPTQAQAAKIEKLTDSCSIPGQQGFTLDILDLPFLGNQRFGFVLGFRPSSDLLMLYFSFIPAVQPTPVGQCELYLNANAVMQGQGGGMIGPFLPGPDGNFLPCPVPDVPELIGLFVEVQATATQLTGPLLTSDAWRLTFGLEPLPDSGQAAGR